MRVIRSFLEDLDARWTPTASGPLRLKVIGSAALMLQVRYARRTKDSDVLESESLTEDVKVSLLALAGPDTELCRRHRIHIDIVPSGLPFLPQQPMWHPQSALNDGLRNFEVEVLDVVDVVVSKLKRFHADDRGDIDAMVQRGHVRHEELIRRFESAVDLFSCDARAEDLPRYVDNLHTIERDSFFVEETDITLPEWICR